MMRPFRGGQGSYDMIVPKFQKVAESRNADQIIMYVVPLPVNNLDFCRGCAVTLQIWDSSRSP